MRPKISVIILNWNGWRDTLECLESLYQIDYSNYNVILVDNGSEDDSIQKIRDYCKGKIDIKSKYFSYSSNNKPINIKEYSNNEIKLKNYENYQLKDLVLIKNEDNYGFTEGNNIGVRFAINSFDPDYILLLNNDVVVEKDTLSKLIECTNIAESAVLQPKVKYYEDGKLNSTGMELDLFAYANSRGKHEIDSSQYDNEIKDKFFYAEGACLLLKKEFLRCLGNEIFDSKLFAYYEDVDLSWSARLYGYKVSYCPNSVCYHKGSQSTGGFGLNMAYWGWRNRIRVLIKNYAFKNLIIMLPLTLLLEFIISIVVSIYKREIKYFFIFFKSLIWNIIVLNDTLKRRKKVQKKRVVNDSYIKNFMVHHSLELSNLKKDILKLF